MMEKTSDDRRVYNLIQAAMAEAGALSALGHELDVDKSVG
jgi:hypothetical protein